MKFDEVTDEYHDGDTLVVGGTAMTFSGVPVPGAKVAYDVQRRCSSWFSYYYGANNDAQQMLTDTVMTDSKGRFEVRIPVVLPADYQADNEGYDVKTPGRFVWQTRHSHSDRQRRREPFSRDEHRVGIESHRTEIGFAGEGD